MEGLNMRIIISLRPYLNYSLKNFCNMQKILYVMKQGYCYMCVIMITFLFPWT